MIIDTDKLKQAVDDRDRDVDFEHCSIQRLNHLESRALKDYAVIERIEEMSKELKPYL